jgi:hypothetical protein
MGQGQVNGVDTAQKGSAQQKNQCEASAWEPSAAAAMRRLEAATASTERRSHAAAGDGIECKRTRVHVTCSVCGQMRHVLQGGANPARGVHAACSGHGRCIKQSEGRG